MSEPQQERANRFMEALASLPLHHPSGEPSRDQPIALLWAISRAAEGADRLTSWSKAKTDLRAMLTEYDTVDAHPTPESTFLELRQFPFWEILGTNDEAPDSRDPDAVTWLAEQTPEGGLESSLHEQLASDKDLCRDAVKLLHEQYFQDHRLDLLLLEAGLPTEEFDGFGAPPHVRVGDTFKRRRTLARARVHRPTMAGICGTRASGAESIVVSGGYDDDEDYGDEIIYTGQGGRDEKTKKQCKDQELTLGNAALVTSYSTGAPVRVIRGAGGERRYSPAVGLRYDGLYRVEECWSQRGKSNFLVWRYRLRAIGSVDKQAATNITRSFPVGNATPGRKETSTQRIIRSTKVADYVKKIHAYACQVCGLRIETPTGAYAEAAHIKPLGHPHNGPDEIDNVLCLCPNHHTAFDFGMLIINDDRSVTQRGSEPRTYQLREIPGHVINTKYLAYHRGHHENINVSTE
ncbi:MULTISPECIES: YDG/SRA domain-containing protein [unclassified Streptomyces]|uniref:YDG/SRA domain-containing protein n=1 Tax=unclassified Streptomyces TaxID=2593676 RepID=UPI001C40AF66|nr:MULTISPECIES: YDG/SRA domain-containing protein [unclassified Streptomyces]